jgi:FkbM family methyltransferase
MATMTDMLQWQSATRSDDMFIRERDFPFSLKLLRWIGRQTWLPRGQDALLRAVCDPDSTKHFQFEVEFFGQRYRGDLAHYLDWQVFCYGAAPYGELSLLRELVLGVRAQRPTPVSFFDIGANVGHHTLFMAPLVDAVVAFEPFPSVRVLIEEKISLNRLGNVEIVPFALGEVDDMLDYFPGAGSNSGAGSFVEDHGSSAGGPVKLTVRNGDGLFDERDFPRIDLMRVDVEGFEPFVFRGLAKRIRRDRPLILTELSPSSYRALGSEVELRSLFYDDAIMFTVHHRHGCCFKLAPFVYDMTTEALIVPAEMATLIDEIE